MREILKIVEPMEEDNDFEEFKEVSTLLKNSLAEDAEVGSYVIGKLTCLVQALLSKERTRVISAMLGAAREAEIKFCDTCTHPGIDDNCCPDQGWNKCRSTMLTRLENEGEKLMGSDHIADAGKKVLYPDCCPVCHCLYDDKATSPMQGRNGGCKCGCGHLSTNALRTSGTS